MSAGRSRCAAWMLGVAAVIAAGCAAVAGEVTEPEVAATAISCCAVLELRQYTLEPGKREVLIELFEREFVDSQEALGMRLAGQFRDAANPDRFVWLRGFRDMPSRGVALAAFYGGPVWQAHRVAANPTIADAANVLLLRPVSATSGFPAPAKARAPAGVNENDNATAAIITATIYALKAPVNDDFMRLFERKISPLMIATGAVPLAVFQTETAENNFPRLPIRTGEHVLVWFSRFPDAASHAMHMKRLADSTQWRDEVVPALDEYLVSPPQQLTLRPTARSLLR